MTTYKTEQKRELINFLTKNSHRSFTIDEMCRGMTADANCISPPGKSTVYRLIPKLLDDNIIKQFNNGASCKTTYQLVGGQECREHIHLKCTKCGRILHTGHSFTKQLSNSLRNTEAFQISIDDTVLFGLCKDCV